METIAPQCNRSRDIITGKQFLNLYSQLPCDCYFAAIVDCCHAGGMNQVGARQARRVTDSFVCNG